MCGILMSHSKDREKENKFGESKNKYLTKLMSIIEMKLADID